MKRTLTYILAAAAVMASACDSNIPERGTVNNALVEEVVLDEVLAAGLNLEEGDEFSLPEHISYLPIDATNTAQTYDVSDPDIADVTELGVLQAKKEGDCTVTVYIGADGVNASFDVHVKKPTLIPISQLRFRETEVEYEKAISPTVDISAMLMVIAESETEESNEKVRFSIIGNTDVATIDAETGVITVNKLGEIRVKAEATITTTVDPAEITVKFYKYVEHERFPGDLEGQQREIMAENWDNLPHTDGGWTLSDFGYEGSDRSFQPGSQRNGYRYAMLDGRNIVARTGGTANDLPIATNGTAFCWTCQGKSGAPSSPVHFVIDMQKPQEVGYFRIVNISDNKDDARVCVTTVSKIEGTDDLNGEWTVLGENITGYNKVNNTTTGYPRESEKAMLTKGGRFRYIKFTMNDQNCYGQGVDKQTIGTTIQIDELYMGYKVYTE